MAARTSRPSRQPRALAHPALSSRGDTIDATRSVIAAIDRAKAPVAAPVRGDCLKPVGIVDGDLVILDTANTAPRNGDVIACTLNGQLLLKVYARDAQGRETLSFSDGSRWLSLTIAPADRLAIVGVYAGLIASGPRRVAGVPIPLRMLGNVGD